MANPFDQFDMPTQGAAPNPFDQFDMPATATSAPRLVGQFAQGANDAIASTLGAPVDLAAWGMRQVGIPANNPIGGSESIKRGFDYLASVPGRVGLTTLGAPVRFEAQGPAEKFAHGAGEGVGNAMSILIPASAIAGAAKAGTVGQGVAEALASQPALQTVASGVGGGVTGATGNPYYGLAAGAAIPVGAAAARGVISPTANMLTEQEARLADAARDAGINLTAGQATGSPLLQGIERTLERQPGSNTVMKPLFEEQRQAFNSAALNKAGVEAKDVSPATMQGAFNKIGQTFDDLASRTTVKPDLKFAADLSKAEADYGRRLPTDVAPVFKSYMDDLKPLVNALVNQQSPEIEGQTFANIRSDLTAEIRSSQSNPKLANALRQIVGALDGAVERSASPELATEWKDARRQYQALMTIDRAAAGGTQADRAAGNIGFNALTATVRQGDRAGFSRGRGQMNELSRVGDFLASKIPNSGTPERSTIANPLHWPYIAGANVGARVYTNPLVQRYLANQVAGSTNLPAAYGGQIAREALSAATRQPNALLPAGSQ